MHVSACVHRDQKRISGPPELELQMTGSQGLAASNRDLRKQEDWAIAGPGGTCL